MTTNLLCGLAVAAVAPCLTAAGLKAPDAAVGRGLQTPVSIVLPQAAGSEGLEVTVTSEDPARVKFSAAPDREGTGSIRVPVAPRTAVIPEFWAQGLANTGSVKYTVRTPGFDAAQGTITLAASALVIVGPFRLPSFPTTPRGVPSKLTIASVMLDQSWKPLVEQPVAGGRKLEIALGNSSPDVGAVADPKLTIAGGTSAAFTYFKPAAEGSTVVTVTQPEGFRAPSEFASVTAVVAKPGLAISDELTVGKNLQLLGVLCLGEAAPEGGLAVTLRSSDPYKLALSAAENETGAGELVLRVPAGKLIAEYYIQGLADSGSVTYEAVAEGFRHRVAKIDLAPSGFIVAYAKYGPPDRAAVQRKGAAESDERRFFVSLGETKDKSIDLMVYSVYLDPTSRLAADITVQPLRAGVTATVRLRSSRPEVGSVESPVEFTAGLARAKSRFTPAKAGETTISVETPPGFAAARNAASAPATVLP